LTVSQRPWKKLINTEEEIEIEFSPEQKPKVFSNIHLATLEAFEGNHKSDKAQTVLQAKPTPKKPDDARPEREPQRDAQDGAKPRTFGMDFPVQEIKKHRRQISDVSDVSDLSEPRQCPLEFSLEKGFKGQSEFYQHLSEDIVRSLERTEYEQDLPMMDKFSRKCLILLMDPRQKLFEIVHVPYEPNKTTVGEMMNMLKDLATDSRLARQSYTGLAHQGMHICAPMVPVDAIFEAEATGKPLLAVPANYSAGQVELFGKTLLECPSVARLLEDQIARLEVSRKQAAPLPTSIDTKVANKITPRQNPHHEPSMAYAQSTNRFLRF
jgi:hypothetical protein